MERHFVAITTIRASKEDYFHFASFATSTLCTRCFFAWPNIDMAQSIKSNVYLHLAVVAAGVATRCEFVSYLGSTFVVFLQDIGSFLSCSHFFA